MIPRPRSLAGAAAALAALSLSACSPAPGSKLAQSDKPRLSAASVPQADVSQQSQDDADFAFELYAQLRAKPGNLFFSPHSISSALAMTWAGAANGTSTAMAGTLHFTLPADRVHGAFNALDQALASRATAGSSEDGGPFKLQVANAIWAQQDLPLQPAFLDVLAQDYGAGVHLEDFVKAPEPARADINGWVSDQTAGKIPELLQQGQITSDTRLVLTNAVYFNGSWKTPFDASLTQPGTFHAADGSAPSVPFMHQVLDTLYASGSGWEAVELPYSNPDLSLTVIVPAAGQFQEVEAQLSGDFLRAVVSSEQLADVTLALPQFKAESRFSLKDALQALGMGEAFGSAADFSGIDGRRDLFIADVVHQANIQVDEKGTEAAAATAVIAAGTAAPTHQVALSVDRPFLIVLRDLPTGAVLFVGRIGQP